MHFYKSNHLPPNRLLQLLFFSMISFYLLPSSLFAEPDFHRVEAMEGETPQKLLQRYHLHLYACNREKFQQLNSLEGEACLVSGRKYYLPVLIYTYNGRSIRSTLGLQESDWDRALRIKDYNEKILKNRLRSKTIYDSRILWVPWHELHCTDEKPSEPAADVVSDHVPGSRRFPIFGPDHEYVPLVDNSLKGKIFYIVAGHGGPDGGAIGKRAKQNLCEDEYAYDVCLRLTRRLLEHGATPYMIIRDPDDGLRSDAFLDCDYDEYCWGNQKIPRGQKSRLFQRSNVINRLYEQNRKRGVTQQYVISIHVDSRSRRERIDVFFYHHPDSKEGKKLAQHMHRAMKKNYRRYREYHGTVSARDLHMVREVKPPTVFIELGNIRHPVDQLRFIKESNRQYLADWLFDGIKDW